MRHMSTHLSSRAQVSVIANVRRRVTSTRASSGAARAGSSGGSGSLGGRGGRGSLGSGGSSSRAAAAGAGSAGGAAEGDTVGAELDDVVLLVVAANEVLGGEGRGEIIVGVSVATRAEKRESARSIRGG